MLEKLKEIRKFCRIYINREYFEYSQRLERRMQQIYVLSRRINRGSHDMKNDIVDVHVRLCEDFRRREVLILDYVHFIMRSPRLFRLADRSRCTTVSGVEPEEMYLHF